MNLTPGLLKRGFDTGHRRRGDQFKSSINGNLSSIFFLITSIGNEKRWELVLELCFGIFYRNVVVIST